MFLVCKQIIPSHIFRIHIENSAQRVLFVFRFIDLGHVYVVLYLIDFFILSSWYLELSE